MKQRKEFNKANGITKNRFLRPDIYSPKIVKLFEEAKEVKTSVIPKIKFRSTSKEAFSAKSLKTMLKERGFYERAWNNLASGFHNDYKLQNDGKVVFDRASGLMWQQSGSDQDMRNRYVNSYIAKLNRDRFAGYNDWRLPTLEEAMSLMEMSEKNGDLFIDQVFDSTQRWICTSDMNGASRAWVVYFGYGRCGSSNFSFSFSVRAVR